MYTAPEHCQSVGDLRRPTHAVFIALCSTIQFKIYFPDVIVPVFTKRNNGSNTVAGIHILWGGFQTGYDVLIAHCRFSDCIFNDRIV